MDRLKRAAAALEGFRKAAAERFEMLAKELSGKFRRRRTDGEEPKNGGHSRRRRLRLALGVPAALLAALFIAAALFFRFHEWRKFEPELITGADRSLIVLDAEGGVISVVSGGEKRIPVPIETLSEKTKYAFISAEDARFYEHSGVDIRRIFGAAWADLKAGALKQGASTIGQQLIKLSHLSGEKTIGRKLEEVWLTMKLEAAYSKDEILEMYLNYVYFGGGFYGIEAASLGYFGVHSADLTVSQAAQLAGILKAPSAYAPHLDLENSLRRRNTVLDLMEKYGYLSSEECESAKAEECVLRNALPEKRDAFVEFAVREAAEKLGMSRKELLTSGCVIRTTLDPAAAAAVSALANEPALIPSETAQTAVVLLRRDGSIAAMCGGRENGGELNRAADMKRQPGSLIKPILCYAPAIESSVLTAASVIEDAETDFEGYSPSNAGGKYAGFVTVRRAVAESLNVPAVKTLELVGTDPAVDFAKKLGISFENEHIGLALALGGFTYGVSPLDMAAAYNAFNTGGLYFEPFCVGSVERDGETLYSRSAQPARAMGEDTAFIMADILRTAASDGTASALAALPFRTAAKTGTNLDPEGGVRDVWTAAFAGEYTAVCWMGTDSASLGTLPPGTTGGNSACRLICALFSVLPEEKLRREDAVPESVEAVLIDAEALAEEHTALLATEYTPGESIFTEYFRRGTAPENSSVIRLLPKPPAQVNWFPDADGNPVITIEAEDERLVYRIFRSSVSGGGERVTAELTGAKGSVSCTDFTAVPGESYFYWAVTVNPFISENGTAAASVPSRRMRVVVLF